MAYIRNHKYHFIYKTTCTVTNRYYIGMHSTSNLNDGYLGSGRRLWLSINKHGKDNHSMEILEFLSDRRSLKAREREIVNETLLLDPMCMNLQPGGEGGFISKDHQLKCSSAGGRTTNPEKSRKSSEKMKETNLRRVDEGSHKSWKQTYDWTGKSHTEEARQKISQANSIRQAGERNSQFGTKWITHPQNGSMKVKSSEVSSYLAMGYILGRKTSIN